MFARITELSKQWAVAMGARVPAALAKDAVVTGISSPCDAMLDKFGRVLLSNKVFTVTASGGAMLAGAMPAITLAPAWNGRLTVACMNFPGEDRRRLGDTVKRLETLRTLRVIWPAKDGVTV